ncbi:hypothetical protein BDW68DRAFT_177431 [Aspergillus falconensis]
MFHGVGVPLLGTCLLLGPAYHGPYAVDLIEFYNGKVAYFYASRMMVAGQVDLTEIIGHPRQGHRQAQPALNLVNIFDNTGIRREIPLHYYDRFCPIQSAVSDLTPTVFMERCGASSEALPG